MEERVKQLCAKLEADGEWSDKLFSRETVAEAQTVLKEAGLEFSLAELEYLRGLVIRTLEKGTGGKLSDDELEGVVSGSIAANCVAIGVLAGAASAVDQISNRRWLNRRANQE
ncbi:MAG: hypothetical protein PHC60_02080 [Heliobacteriaceae bacterium]|nr:hypothetical protein [Heliobacteriaceae bacterium]